MPAFLVLGVAMAVFAIATRVHKKDAPRPVEGVQHFELDHGMPAATVHQVLTALVHGQDPAELDALAQTIPNYPLASGELRARASMLRAASSPASPHPAAVEPPARPTGHASVAPAPPRGEPSASAKEGRIDATNVLQAAMRALVEERDPVVLDGFAESIRIAFPVASGILETRASELRNGAPSLPSSPPASPVATNPTSYVVRAGDSAASIAHRLVHDGRRAQELVAANPTKPRARDGNFASLRPGEELHLPASWTAQAAPSPLPSAVLAAAHEVHP